MKMKNKNVLIKKQKKNILRQDIQIKIIQMIIEEIILIQHQLINNNFDIVIIKIDQMNNIKLIIIVPINKTIQIDSVLFVVNPIILKLNVQIKRQISTNNSFLAKLFSDFSFFFLYIKICDI